MQSEYAWTLEFETESVWATLDGAVGPRVIGGDDSPTFVFYSKDIAGKDPPLPKDHTDRYETVLDHCKYAGSFALHNDTDAGNTLYREQHSGKSLLVKFEPEYDAPGPAGVWGLIAGYSDETVLPQKLCVLELDIEVLAWADDYDNHEQVKSDLEMRGL